MVAIAKLTIAALCTLAANAAVQTCPKGQISVNGKCCPGGLVQNNGESACCIPKDGKCHENCGRSLPGVSIDGGATDCKEKINFNDPDYEDKLNKALGISGSDSGSSSSDSGSSSGSSSSSDDGGSGTSALGTTTSAPTPTGSGASAVTSMASTAAASTSGADIATPSSSSAAADSGFAGVPAGLSLLGLGVAAVFAM